MLEKILVEKVELAPGHENDHDRNRLVFLYGDLKIEVVRSVGDRWNVVLAVRINGTNVMYNVEATQPMVEAWGRIHQKLFGLQDRFLHQQSADLRKRFDEISRGKK